VAIANGNVRALMAMYFCYGYGAHFFITWLHIYLVRSRGFTDKELAMFSPMPFVLGALSNIAGGYVSDALVHRWGLKWGRRTCGLAGLTAAGLLLAAAALSTGKYSSIVFLTLAYGCSDFMMPSAWATCLDISRGYPGTISGAMNTAGQLGSFVSAVLFGYLVTALHSYDLPLLAIAAMVLISAAQWLRIDPARPLQLEQTSSSATTDADTAGIRPGKLHQTAARSRHAHRSSR
jgi:ACS family glucarate transporter-like MFS transporter